MPREADQSQPPQTDSGRSAPDPGTPASEGAAGSERQSQTTSSSPPSGPEITLEETVAGRDTLAAIAGELAPGHKPGRPLLTTLGYGDRVSNAPGAPSPATERYMDSGPKVSVRETIPGRETLSAIEEELRRAPRTQSGGPLEFLEMLTFVVRGSGSEAFASASARQQLVAEHLLARLPVESMDQVERIDVSPWGRGALLLRVWCRIGT